MTRVPATRLAGIATAEHGLALRRAALPGRCGWAHDDTARRTAARIAGFRDFASGPALALAPTEDPVRPASSVGIGSDRGDTVALGRASRGQPQCAETTPTTAGRGLLCAAHTGRG
ncbi:hypothetical protein [Nocardia abscessus]|uniref:hypothetical protein n=1 Tax=Nocardia abscessus TaxID=120957 RepID=UPI0005BDE5D8|nr:hypothetical protein [Nocardia abscessus]MCC3329384.1 hypothetical protein [Nocardia abscessus]